MGYLSVIVLRKQISLLKNFFKSSKSKFTLNFISLNLAKIFNHEKILSIYRDNKWS